MVHSLPVITLRQYLCTGESTAAAYSLYGSNFSRNYWCFATVSVSVSHFPAGKVNMWTMFVSQACVVFALA